MVERGEHRPGVAMASLSKGTREQMNGGSFDALTRLLTSVQSRRIALQAGTAGALALVGGVLADPDLSEARSKRKKLKSRRKQQERKKDRRKNRRASYGTGIIHSHKSAARKKGAAYKGTVNETGCRMDIDETYEDK